MISILFQQWEFFTFAGLMTIFSLILAFVAHRYQYVYYTEGDPDQLRNLLYVHFVYLFSGEQNSNNGVDNMSFSSDHDD